MFLIILLPLISALVAAGISWYPGADITGIALITAEIALVFVVGGSVLGGDGGVILVVAAAVGLWVGLHLFGVVAWLPPHYW